MFTEIDLLNFLDLQRAQNFYPRLYSVQSHEYLAPNHEIKNFDQSVVVSYLILSLRSGTVLDILRKV